MSHEPMHRIIRLKRYEQPPEGYFDDFLTEFRRRREQEELAPPSLASRIRESIDLFFESFRVPTMAFAGAAAVALVACLAIFRETSRPATPRIYDVSYSAPVTIQGMLPVSWKPSQQQADPASMGLTSLPLLPGSSMPAGPVKSTGSNTPTLNGGL
jgi:hypothetical protein